MNAIIDRPTRHLIPASEYLRMGEAGVFPPEARLELIDGEIIEMAPIGPPHAGSVKTLLKLFVTLAGDSAIVSVQDPIIASELSVPQPDVALLKPRADNYRKSHPVASDVLLVVEVSDSTIGFDLGVKARLYGQAGIREYWVVDVERRAIQVFRDPGAMGYATSFKVEADASVAAQSLPVVAVSPAMLFPPDE